MAFTKTDLVEDILLDVLIQYQSSPNLTGWLKALAEDLEITQQSIIELVNNVDVNIATGELLDFLGKIAVEPRNGRGDDEYREAIKLKRLLNTSEGVPDKLLTAVYEATDATKVKIWEHFPWQTSFYTNGANILLDLPDKLRQSSPATSNEVVVYYDPLENAFTPSELLDEIADLIDQDNNDIVDNVDDNIAVRDRLQTATETSLLSEYCYGLDPQSPLSPDGRGVLCESSVGDKGIDSESLFE